MQKQSNYLYYLIIPSFQGANKPSILIVEGNAVTTAHIDYNNNVMNYDLKFFDEPVKMR